MIATPFAETATTLAVIAWSHEPLLFLTSELSVIAASASFCDGYQIDCAGLAGRPLAQVGDGEWATPKMLSLLHATLSGTIGIDGYEFDLVRAGQETRFVLLSARKLPDEDGAPPRLLLAITDVSGARVAAREKDDLVRRNEMLLQEILHRVANSLQIIASVLMQSARKVLSEEARGHLQDAHRRVLSIAAMQRHLAQSTLPTVSLRAYFVQLCESLSASMIGDRNNFSIEATIDDTVVDANQSVSMGLIITELVINALKHAFINQTRGVIAVDYSADGDNWTLSVKDDGVGMAKDADDRKPGLGTGIVEALANKLEAEIVVTDNAPGTIITIIHRKGAERRVLTRAA